jgi:N-acetylneuraminic acid mutarotase
VAIVSLFNAFEFMKNIIYFTFLITTALSPKLLAQNKYVDDVSWSIAAQIPAAYQQTKSIGLAGAIIGITDQRLLIAGGTNFPDKMPWHGGKKRYYNDIFLYEKNDQELNLTKDQFKLPFNLAYGAVCCTPTGIVVAGGENEDGLSCKVLLLNWSTGTINISYLPDLPKGLTNAALTLVEHTLYLAGGEVENATTAQFLSLDLKAQNEGWKVHANLPHAVSHAVLLSSEQEQVKEIYLIGGRKRNPADTSTIYNHVYAYQIKEHAWKEKRSLPYPVSAATGIIKGRSILVFSGDKGETFHKAEKLINEIALEKNATKKEILDRQKTEVQSNHPGFSKTVLKYDLVTNLWSALNSQMPYGLVTTRAVLFNNKIVIAGGEVKAGVRTPNIIIGKLKQSK